MYNSNLMKHYRIAWATKMTRIKKIRLLSILATLPLLTIFLYPSSSQAANPVLNAGSTTNFGVLAGTTVTNTGATTIGGTAGGDLGIFPGSSVTGGASITLSGTQHLADTAANTAQTDLVTLFNNANAPAPTVLASPDLVSQVLTPGTYSNGSGTFANSGALTLDAQGDPNAIFIFQTASTLITSVGSTVSLIGNAQACNVYWVVGSSATLGTNSTFVGKVLALTTITANSGASIQGQLLARNGAVNLNANTITNASCATSTPTPTATATATASPCTATISNLVYTTGGGAGATTGKLTWTTSGPGLFQFVGDSTLYPAPYNYGTATSTWNGSLANMVPATNYPVTVKFVASCGLASQASTVASNLVGAIVPTPTPTTGTLNVIKNVVNTYGGNAVASDFMIHVTHNGTDVAGSPAVGMSGTGRAYTLAPGTYLVSENHMDGYYGTFANTDPALGGNITDSGLITISAGQVATITRTNYQVAPTYTPGPTPSATPFPPTPTTVTGGKLPKTGSPWYNFLLLGFGLITLGGVGFLVRKPSTR